VELDSERVTHAARDPFIDRNLSQLQSLRGSVHLGEDEDRRDKGEPHADDRRPMGSPAKKDRPQCTGHDRPHKRGQQNEQPKDSQIVN